jgi:hypothetical protein
MSKSLFDHDNFKIFLSRFEKLTPQSRAQWGKMNVAQMLGHLEKAIDSGLEHDIKPPFDFKKLLLANPLGKGIMFNLPEWPKHMPAPPEYVISDNVAFEENLNTCVSKLHKFKDSDGPFGEHPLFGKMNKNEWGQLLYKHADHHLKQFGV